MRKTVFLDIDGCIFNHPGNFIDITMEAENNKVLPWVMSMFSNWEVEGTCIVLTTGRKECQREATEKQLLSHGLFWDRLIMGLNNGPRIVINDRKRDGTKTAFAVNLDRNEGMESLLDMDFPTEQDN
jgi:hypothetical protein